MGRFVVGVLVVVALALAGSPPGSRVRLEPSQAAAGQESGQAEVQQSAPADPAELRTTLEKLLAHHATLVVRLNRAELRRDPDFLEAATAALDGNTGDLKAAVEAVYGADAAATFERLWGDHIRSLFLYSSGVASQDEAARTQARQELDAYREEFGSFLENATGGELSAAAVSEALGAHVDLLLRQTDAYAAQDYAGAYQLQREAYAHMFPVAATLAGAFAGGTAADSAPQELRSALGKLFGEHLELAVDAMRSGVTGAPDFEQAAAALDGNTSDLTAAVEGLVGAEGARQFTQLWPTHIDLLVDYTVGLAENNEAAKQEALAGLRQVEGQIGAFLAQAAGGNVAAQDLSAAVLAHDRHLLEQIDAYAAQDYEAAHRITYDAYQHMFDMAATLATAIEAAQAGVIPQGGAQTGAGGSSQGHH